MTGDQVLLPSDPMLAAAVFSPMLPTGSSAEPKWDGYRALGACEASGTVLLEIVSETWHFSVRPGTDLFAT